MTSQTDPNTDCIASLDADLQHRVFDTNSIAQTVEASLLHLSTQRAQDQKTQTCMLRTIRIAVTAWRGLWSAKEQPQHPLQKMGLSLTALYTTPLESRTEGILKYDTVGCLTAPLKTVTGANVPVRLLQDTISACGKIYLLLSQQLQLQQQTPQTPDVPGQRPNGRTSTRHVPPPPIPPYLPAVPSISQPLRGKTPVRNPPPNPKRVFQSVSTIPPSHPDYDPLFPRFTKDSAGVMGNGDTDSEGDSPERGDGTGKGKVKGKGKGKGKGDQEDGSDERSLRRSTRKQDQAGGEEEVD